MPQCHIASASESGTAKDKDNGIPSGDTNRIAPGANPCFPGTASGPIVPKSSGYRPVIRGMPAAAGRARPASARARPRVRRMEQDLAQGDGRYGWASSGAERLVALAGRVGVDPGDSSETALQKRLVVLL